MDDRYELLAGYVDQLRLDRLTCEWETPKAYLIGADDAAPALRVADCDGDDLVADERLTIEAMVLAAQTLPDLLALRDAAAAVVAAYQDGDAVAVADAVTLLQRRLGDAR